MSDSITSRSFQRCPSSSSHDPSIRARCFSAMARPLANAGDSGGRDPSPAAAGAIRRPFTMILPNSCPPSSPLKTQPACNSKRLASKLAPRSTSCCWAGGCDARGSSTTRSSSARMAAVHQTVTATAIMTAAPRHTESAVRITVSTSCLPGAVPGRQNSNFRALPSRRSRRPSASAAIRPAGDGRGGARCRHRRSRARAARCS